MDQAIQNGVRQGGIANAVMPVLDGQLTGDQGGTGLITVIQDLQEVMSVPISQGFQPPVVQHEHIDLGQALEELGIAAVRMGNFKVGEQPGQALVEHMIAVPTGLMAQGTGDVGLADTGGSQNEHIAMLADPLIAGQALQEAAVEAPGSLPVQIFQCVNQRRNLNRCQRPILNSFRGGESGVACNGRSRSPSR